jgi:hypothetical protein
MKLLAKAEEGDMLDHCQFVKHPPSPSPTFFLRQWSRMDLAISTSALSIVNRRRTCREAGREQIGRVKA